MLYEPALLLLHTELLCYYRIIACSLLYICLDTHAIPNQLETYLLSGVRNETQNDWPG
jgi:hypothetical protein